VFVNEPAARFNVARGWRERPFWPRLVKLRRCRPRLGRVRGDLLLDECEDLGDAAALVVIRRAHARLAHS
jgi:hypothetical protein